VKKIKHLLVNLITLSRISLAPLIIYIDSKNLILYTAIWVAFSDFLDGVLARKWNVVTSFGAKFDQYADKIASLFFLFYFLQQKQLSIFFVSLVLLRELLIVIFRYYKCSYTQSNFISKTKTFFLYILFIFLSSQHIFASLGFDIKRILQVLVIVSSWLSFLLTIIKIKAPLVYFISTSGLSATIVKKVPGTISSFVACILFFILLKSLSIEYKIAILVILFIFHFSYYKDFLKLIRSINDDPSVYTIDETLAIVMAWIYLGELNIINLIFLFTLFRFFDILKPLGIRSIEKQLNWSPVFRNLADDILAIFYASLILLIIQQYVA
jgi:phosphatidylglycerophosphate synthase